MARIKPKPEEIAEVFIDESSQTMNRYLVLGGVVFDGLNRETIFEKLTKARLPELPKGEMKWGKVSRTKLPAYKRMVDVFWYPEFADNFHFHSLVADSSKFDHKRFNQGSREIGFSKEIFQIASKFGRLYGGVFHVYLDERNTNQRPEELRLILNRSAKSKGDKRDWPYRRCHFRDSKICPALQIVDVFIGAVGFYMNGHISAADASPAKIELAKYIMGKAGIRNVATGTSRSGKFTIWHRQLR
jgi:hypothetical protein